MAVSILEQTTSILSPLPLSLIQRSHLGFEYAISALETMITGDGHELVVKNRFMAIYGLYTGIITDFDKWFDALAKVDDFGVDSLDDINPYKANYELPLHNKHGIISIQTGILSKKELFHSIGFRILPVRLSEIAQHGWLNLPCLDRELILSQDNLQNGQIRFSSVQIPSLLAVI